MTKIIYSLQFIAAFVICAMATGVSGAATGWEPTRPIEFVIPAGTEHNISNSGHEALKLYTIYSPPEHKDGVVHATKQDAVSDREDHFDGKTTATLQESSAQNLR